jgi:hypothetical protein
MSIIIPANSAVGGGYDVDNSLRFNKPSSDSLSKSFSSPDSRDTFTVSAWLKMTGGGGVNQTPIVSFDGSNQYMAIRFQPTTSKFDVISYQGGTTARLISNALYRDYSAWYHIVAAIDSTQGTSSNRMKLYVNGEQITSFATASYPSQNTDMISSSMSSVRVGAGVDQTAATSYYDGYMAEVCYIDGQQLDPTSFGEFDEDSGIWKPIDVSELTFGTNGFYLPFENSGALGQDDSGNGNNFTVNNLTAIDQTTDTPTNNFATLNSLVKTASQPTFSEGNLKIAITGNWNSGAFSSIGLSSGKWYWEAKAITANDANIQIGVCTENINFNASVLYNETGTLLYETVGGRYLDGTYTASVFGSSYVNNSIIGVALDLDSGTKTVTFTKDGSTMTGGTQNLSSNFNNAVIFPMFIGSNSSATGGWELNFGNAPYAISSGNQDGNGYGNFEYAVPSGYYALNTKNLAEYG